MQNRVLLMNEIPKYKLRAGFSLLEVFFFNVIVMTSLPLKLNLYSNST